LNVSWSSGVPTLTASIGKVFGTPARWSNGFYRFMGISASSAPYASGAKARIAIVPSSNAAGAKGSVIVYGAQLE
jgi:hypothetical protein